MFIDRLKQKVNQSDQYMYSWTLQRLKKHSHVLLKIGVHFMVVFLKAKLQYENNICWEFIAEGWELSVYIRKFLTGYSKLYSFFIFFSVITLTHWQYYKLKRDHYICLALHDLILIWPSIQKDQMWSLHSPQPVLYITDHLKKK